MRPRPGHQTKLWEYSYPLVHGQVRNNAVSMFQRNILALKETNPAKILHDFARNYYVDGKLLDSKATVEDMDQLLKDFVSQAKVYSPKEQELIVEYLRTRGGQDNNFLIQYLVMNNHFTEDGLQALSSVNQEFIDSNWSINSKGQIEFNYCVELQSFEIRNDENQEVLTITEDGSGRVRYDDLASTEFYERRKAGLKPLLRLTFSLHLELINNRVIPIVDRIHIDGYNDAIYIHQDNFGDRRDQRTELYFKLIKNIDAKILFFAKDLHIQKQLMKIKHLVLESNYGQDFAPLKLACEYIKMIPCTIKKFIMGSENIRIASLLNNDPEFKKHHSDWFHEAYSPSQVAEGILPQLNQYGINDIGSISNKDYSKSDITFAFGQLYLDLQAFVKRYVPLHVTQLGDTPIFEEWLEQYRANDKQTHVALNQFRAGCQIGDVSINRKSEDKAINNAVGVLAAYASDDNQVKKEISNWILSLGTTFPETLIDMMINSDEIQIQNLPQQLRSSMEKPLHLTPHITSGRPSWEINMNGLITFSCTYNVYSLRCDGVNRVGYRNPHDHKLGFLSTSRQINHSNMPPIMRFEFKVDLEIIEERVTPRLSVLKIDSYSSDVTPSRPSLEHSDTMKVK